MARDLRMQRPMPQNRRTGRIPSPSNIPEAGQYQAPGTSGIGDYGLGLLYEENPDWFGTGWGWGNMGDIEESWNIWEEYLAGNTQGMTQFMSEEEAEDWYAQQEAGWNWWNQWNPENTSQWSWQNVNYNLPSPGGTGHPQFTGQATNPPNTPGASFTGPYSGGGSIGGSGDLGTGSAFAGGSMYNTIGSMWNTGGLWDYDCDTLGPSYNSAGECIACCN